MDGNLLGGFGQNGADVGGHIVGPFGAVDVVGALWDQLGEKVFQIHQDVGVGIFLDQKTGGGVADKNGAEAIKHLALTHHGGDLGGDFVEGFAASGHFETSLVEHAGGRGDNYYRIQCSQLKDSMQSALVAFNFA